LNIYRIVGPPGTGKTYKILELIASACDKYSPEHIGAVSHTNTAVNTMIDRIIQSSDVDPKVIKWVKTEHGMCFNLLSLDKEQVADKNLREWNKEFPQYMLKTTSLDEDQTKNELIDTNEEIWQAIQICRNKMTPEGSWPAYVLDFWKCWKNWCTEMGYIDFTGMLEQILLIGRCPPVKVLFVDEAQDLTKLQLEVIMMWAKSVEVCCLVGDADQCIYRFAGAEPENFRNISYKWGDVLTQSYRVPPTVHKKAMDILSQIYDREKIEYRPCNTNGEGQVIYCNEPDFSLPGKHMIIARCNFRVEHWRRRLESEYMLWENPWRPEDKILNIEKTSEFSAIKTYLKLAHGEDVFEPDLKKMAIKIRAEGNIKRGEKKIIEAKIVSKTKKIDIFDYASWGFTDNFLAFNKSLDEIISFKTLSGKYAKILADMDKLDQEAVILGTIHSVKGGEADNVWIDPIKTRRILQAEAQDQSVRDDELRIMYVAITRSKNTVGIMGRR